GVYATGTGVVTISGVNISNVAMGVWVKGGTLTMDKGSIEFKRDYGVKVESGVTSATLTDVVIRGTSGQGKGVLMESSQTLEMTNVDVLNVFVGQNRKSNRKIVTFIRLRKRGCTILVIIKRSLL
uniref:right-handed parallel beta-helix repeat-containing protein n=1 Tax=Bartonella bovis TaxID=155194 RepID=UPI001304F42A